MSDIPVLLALRDVSLGFGNKPLFSDLDIQLLPKDRVCLIGRNGCGKSTLLKLLVGLIEPDSGIRFIQPGQRVGYLPQEPIFVAENTVYEHIEAGILADVPEQEAVGSQAYRIMPFLEILGLDGVRSLAHLSGGERRRCDLARVLVGEPDILLLDEPTNHLDIAAIAWLESWLAQYRGAVLTISHDRAFLNTITNRLIWLDRGQMRRLAKGFVAFEAWADAVQLEEEREAQRLNSKLRAENHWLARGVTARRRRNQGRLQRLVELRAQRAAMMRRSGPLSLSAAEGEVSGRLVIEAEEISKGWEGQPPFIKNFSTRILRGDRLGVIGANGVGKTSLLQMLTGVMLPDQGRIRLGTGLEIARFDQNRTMSDPTQTLWQFLCPQGGDQVKVGQKSRHVVGYLRDFLFDQRQVKAPISSLSGGERSRLMLAELLARPSTLMVLDEPTNDLDMDTLDLLQEMLTEYQGTLLVVSHDRDFLDRIATGTLVLPGDGTVEDYPGGYTDCVRQRGRPLIESIIEKSDIKKPKETKFTKAKSGKSTESHSGTRARKTHSSKLSYRDQYRLEHLPAEMTLLNEKIAQLEAHLAEPGLYTKDPVNFRQQVTDLAAAQAKLAEAEELWLVLSIQRDEFLSVAAESN